MARKLISLSLSKLSYSALAGFAQTIHDGFITLIAIFATPNPTMVILQGDIDNLLVMIAKWGVKGNRGSTKDHANLKTAANLVREDLRMLADYAMNKAPYDPDSWIAVGFKLKKNKTKPPYLQMVQNFHQDISAALPAPIIRLRWKRPLDTERSQVKVYFVVRNNVPIYPVSTEGHAIINIVGIVTDTAFSDVEPMTGENWYFVVPYNSSGLGVVSDPLLVKYNP